MNPNLLAPNHPSAKCEQAWFLFSIGDPIVRLILVEAKNQCAVQVIEYLAATNKICLPLLTVHRQCEFIGIRSDMVEEVPYVDFMLDMVQIPDLDPIGQVFLASLSPEEKIYTAKKLDVLEATMNQTPAPSMPPCPVPKSIPRNDMQEDIVRDRITGALVNLGFNKRHVTNFINGLGDRLMHERVDVLIKEGIQQISGN